MIARARAARLAAPALALALTLAACGSSAGSRTPAPSASATVPGLPSGWGTARLAGAGELVFPPGWRRIESDRGSASAALLAPDGTIRVYLNATPADRDETPSGWARFRLRHNADEGDRDVRLISSAAHVTLGAETGSCVSDTYATSRTRYRERACLLTPPAGGRRVVLVAAAQPGMWTRERAELDFALAHFRS